jgi:hypothetical protein
VADNRVWGINVRLRLWRRVRIAPGVTVNLSKGGLSTSVGPRGAKVTLGRGRVTKTVGLPGSGLYLTTTGSTPGAKPMEQARLGGTTPSGGGHRRRNLGIGAAVVVTLVAVANMGQSTPADTGSTSATSTPRPTATLSFVAGPSVAPSTSPSIAAAAPTATAKPTPKPTAKPTPKPTPKPTKAPALALTASVTSPVDAGSQAKVTAKTHASARCSIEVDYASGPSDAAGLGSKKANSSGSVSWVWKVGTNTTPGTWDIYVTCTWSGLEKTKHLRFRVR